MLLLSPINASSSSSSPSLSEDDEEDEEEDEDDDDELEDEDESDEEDEDAEEEGTSFFSSLSDSEGKSSSVAMTFLDVFERRKGGKSEAERRIFFLLSENDS